MTDPIVDVIIPVHTERRPIARAVASVLATASIPTRVSVVCHNVDSAAIASALGDWADDSRVRLLHLVDGIPSPAGPINVGLDHATGEFTALLGSDDEYEPGALEAWVAVARRDGADVVIPPLRSVPGGWSPSPPTRPWRRRHLDGVRDRLAYRTVQLGLVARRRFGDLRMTSSLRTGEDVIQGATLWFSDASISLLHKGPGYLIHADKAEERASASRKPAAESLQFLDAVLDPAFVSTLTARQHEAFAVKLLRTHVMDILGASLRSGALHDDLPALAEGVRRILALSPTAASIMSRRDARILMELLGPADPVRLVAEHAIRTDYRRLANVFPASARRVCHREAPPRFLAAVAFTR